MLPITLHQVICRVRKRIVTLLLHYPADFKMKVCGKLGLSQSEQRMQTLSNTELRQHCVQCTKRSSIFSRCTWKWPGWFTWCCCPRWIWKGRKVSLLLLLLLLLLIIIIMMMTITIVLFLYSLSHYNGVRSNNKIALNNIDPFWCTHKSVYC